MKGWFPGLILSLFVTAGVSHAETLARTGVLLVLDYSGSMEAATETRSISRIARLRKFVTDLADSYVREGYDGTIGVIQFGARRSGTCDDFEVLARPSGQFDRAAYRDLIGAVNSMSPKGRTPLEESTKLAIREADRLIREDRADAVRLILISDMQDTCDGAAYVEADAVTDEMLCNQGKRVQTTLDDVVAKLRRDLNRVLPAEVIKIEYVVSVLSGVEANNLKTFTKCGPPTEIVVPPFIRPPPKPPRVILPAPLITTANVMVTPVLAKPDSLGRDVGNPVLEVAVDGKRIGAALDLPPSGHSITDIDLGSALTLSLVGAGLPAILQVTVDQDKEVEIPWRLPTLSARPKPAPERDWPDDVSLALGIAGGPTVERPFPSDLQFDLKPGDYVLTARRPGYQDEVVKVALARSDGSVEIPAPMRPLVIPMRVELTVGQPTLDLGPMPNVTVELVEDGFPAVDISGLGLVDLSVGGAYSYRVTASYAGREEVFAEGQIPELSPGSPLAGLSVFVVPPQVTLGATAEGEWTIINAETRQQDKRSGTMMTESLPPGSYLILFDGRNVCAENGVMALSLGAHLQIDPAGNAPEECQ